MRYFEDIQIGDEQRFGKYSITEEEIIDFGKKFDPQPFHTSKEKAKETSIGALIASGWHTCAIFMKLFVDEYLKGGNGMPSPGVDNISWLKPVKPGDTLSVRVTVSSLRLSKSKPNRGIIKNFCEVINQNHETVLTMYTNGFVPVKNPVKINK